jgi:hypothetical protein
MLGEEYKMRNKLNYLLVMLIPFSIQACAGEASQAPGSQAATEQNGQSVSVQVTSSDKEIGDVQSLLAIIRDERLRESDPERITKAIEALGEMRAADASEDLARLLTFKGKFQWEKDQTSGALTHLAPPGSLYPATTALFQIGKPALPALVRVIEEHESDSLESVNATDTIILIFRERPAGAADYLKKEAAKSATPDGAQRLNRAAEKAKANVG